MHAEAERNDGMSTTRYGANTVGGMGAMTFAIG